MGVTCGKCDVCVPINPADASVSSLSWDVVCVKESVCVPPCEGASACVCVCVCVCMDRGGGGGGGGDSHRPLGGTGP